MTQNELSFGDSPTPRDRKKAAERISALTRLINHHNDLYYQQDNQEISDREFDALLRELEDLEAIFPDLADPNSPTQKVGGAPLTGFTTVAHSKPMLSLQNSYDQAEVRDFDTRVKRLLETTESVPYVVELKIDGVAIAIRYEDGRFVQGLTRGDGHKGDDVTANLRTIDSLPLQLDPKQKPPAELECRGEVFFPTRDFEQLNKQRTGAGEKTFANPRNAAAGTLKLLDPRKVAQRPLALFLYAIAGEMPPGITTQDQLLDRLRELSLPVNPHARRAADIDEALQFLQEWEEKRSNLEYETDGLVLKVDSLAWQHQLGATSKAPRWCIAYKFATEEALTHVLAVNFQVGRTGVITPVADLEPVDLLGTIVRRATLHNADEIKRLGIRIGDCVKIIKGGEIIPKVLAVETSKRTGQEKAIRFPTSCPVCRQRLERDEEEAATRCLNEHCPAQIKRRVEHFASREAMNIDGLGRALIDQLVDKKLISDIADLYSLTADSLLDLDRMGERSATKLIDAIEVSKQASLRQLIFGLGIRHVGINAAGILASALGSTDNLTRASEESLADLPEIGPILAASVVHYFNQPKTKQFLKRLASAGLSLEEKGETTKGLALQGQIFVLTGKLPDLTRPSAKRMIEDQGGRVTATVSRNTNYLIAGEDPGSKYQKAVKLGIPILDQHEFLKLIDGAS